MTQKFSAIKHHRNYLKEEQYQKVIDYFFDQVGNYRQWTKDRAVKKAMLFYTLWRTGRRISEVIGQKPYDKITGLRPRDIDREMGTITFNILKKNPVKKTTRSGQQKSPEQLYKEQKKKPPYQETIAYDTEFIQRLCDFIDQYQIPDDHRIFDYDRSYIHRCLKQASKDLNLNLGIRNYIDNQGNSISKNLYITPHSFRHGFSMKFLDKQKENPLALPALQEILVHSSLNVTKSYLKLDQSDRRKMLNKVFEVEPKPEEELK